MSRIAEGLPLTVELRLPGRRLAIAVWLAQVGRVPVLLLDTDIVDNADEDRPITNILYVRGREMRLHQELVLGIGGVRALRALGLEPAVWHLNEGHSAFLLAERAREYVAAGRAPRDALGRCQAERASSRSTRRSRPATSGSTRTSSAASPARSSTRGGVPVEKVLDLGLGTDGDPSQFDMTAFSLRLTHGANAVSKLHAATANATWSSIDDAGSSRRHERRPRPDLGRRNPWWSCSPGISAPSWIELDAGARQDRFWERLSRIPSDELWEAHLRQKRELAIFVHGRLRSQLARHGESPAVLAEVDTSSIRAC